MKNAGPLTFAASNRFEKLLRTRLGSIAIVREIFFWLLRRDMRKHRMSI